MRKQLMIIMQNKAKRCTEGKFKEEVETGQVVVGGMWVRWGGVVSSLRTRKTLFCALPDS